MNKSIVCGFFGPPCKCLGSSRDTCVLTNIFDTEKCLDANVEFVGYYHF